MNDRTADERVEDPAPTLVRLVRQQEDPPTDGVSPELALVSPELRMALIEALPLRTPDGWMPVRRDAGIRAPTEAPAEGAEPPLPPRDTASAPAAAPPESNRTGMRGVLAVGGALLQWILTGLGVAVVATSALTALARTPEPLLTTTEQETRSVAMTAPLVAWDDVSAGTGYSVEVRRRGVPVLRLTRRTPDFRLPGRWVFDGQPWALERGAYQYVVRAGAGQTAAGGKIVARGTFTAVPSEP